MKVDSGNMSTKYTNTYDRHARTAANMAIGYFSCLSRLVPLTCPEISSYTGKGQYFDLIPEIYFLKLFDSESGFLLSIVS